MKKTEISTFLEIDISRGNSVDRTLYLAVILQALLDATKPAYTGEPEMSEHDRDRAKAWFFASVGVTAHDFQTVCENAGIDPSYLRGFAFKVLESKEIEYVRKRINAILTHS
jgi:hypothetical protein